MLMPVQETQVQVERGPAPFAQLALEEQLAILRPARWEAYPQGRFQLEDLVQRTEHSCWGSMWSKRQLRDIVGPEEARALLASARSSGPGGVASGGGGAGRGTAPPGASPPPPGPGLGPSLLS